MSVDPNGASLHHGFWQNYGQRPGQGGRKLLIETRIPDALSVDPDPGCPFLGPGSRMPVPWTRIRPPDARSLATGQLVLAGPELMTETDST